jgi:hypothetical protein
MILLTLHFGLTNRRHVPGELNLKLTTGPDITVHYSIIGGALYNAETFENTVPIIITCRILHYN